MFNHPLFPVAAVSIFVLMASGCGSRNEAPHLGDDSPETAGHNELSVSDVEQLLRAGKHDLAAEMVNRLLVREGNDVKLTYLAARIEVARKHPRRAFDLAVSIDLADPAFGPLAAKLLVEQSILLGEESIAESTLRSMIKREPETAQWRHHLWWILDRQGRRQEASEQAVALCRLGQATVPELISLIRRSEIFPTPQNQQTPDPERFQTPLARAKWHFSRQEYADAERELLPQSETGFERVATAALCLRVLAAQQKISEFARVHSLCPDDIRGHADYWCALSVVFIDRAEYRIATGLLLRAVEIDPTMRIAFQRLSRCLDALGRREDAEQFRYRGIQIAETETVARRILEDPGNSLAKRDLAKMLLEIGRPFEVLEWTRTVTPPSATQQLAMLAQQRRAIAAAPNSDKIAASTALLGLDHRDFPIDVIWDELREHSSLNTTRIVAKTRPATAIPRLVNVAAQAKLGFQWYHDEEINLDTIPLYESLGGGIAVLDFDLDGWPDLYFGQGSGRPPKFACTRSSQLLRNFNGRFSDVTGLSQCQDFNYSSGIAAGDVNQDGFPDLYLGALGKNRLLINNGDGTFRDATASLGTSEDFFTTSLAIGDLDGDHLPDLFEVNYIETEGGFVEPKRDKSGIYELPSPALFLAQSDRFFRSKGDGHFASRVIGDQVAKPATGLGVIVTNFDQTHGNEVFIGNDLRVNHFLRLDDGDFVNLAKIKGVASGFHGLANGCMGIATGDFDRSGTLDLHVSNYRDESDNLFLQNDDGSFLDAAAFYGVRDISLPYVAFGSKALDFDRNGWLDLAVTNGHIFDMRHMNQGYRMPPNCLLSRGDGFQRTEVQDPSEYWDGEYLGRAMVVTDFNRNGFSDLVIGHLDAPTALLDNQTVTKGNNLILELVGTTSERDAVGAKITVSSEGDVITQWVTAGDGYLGSDEPYLDLSIAENSTIESVEIDWPSGRNHVYVSIRPNHRYLLIENEPTAFLRDFGNDTGNVEE